VGFAGDVAGFLGNAWNMAVAPGNMAADATKNLFKGKPKNNQTASYSGGSGGLGGAGGGGGGINGITVNVYGKATKTDAEEVIRLVREHERRNGTAWRK
jgi:hypothetical protein